MSRILIGVKFVNLVEAFELLFDTCDIGRRRRLVFSPEQPQERAGQIFGHVDGGHRLTLGQILGSFDYTSAVAINGGIYPLDVAGDKISLPAAGTKSDDTDLVATVALEPLPGNAHYYLVRSQNPCGQDMGVDSEDDARNGRDCP